MELLDFLVIFISINNLIMAKAKKVVDPIKSIVSQYEDYAITQIDAVYALVELMGQATRSEIHNIMSKSKKRTTLSSSVGRSLSTMVQKGYLVMSDETTRGNYDLPNHYFKIK